MQKYLGHIIFLLVVGVSRPAFAHHAMGGRLPSRFDEGLFSGLAHPIINLQHFSFIVAVGVLAAAAQGSRLLPAWFVVGTAAGCYLVSQQAPLSQSALFIPISLLVIGAALAWKKRLPSALVVTAFFAGGLLHGSAYAEAIVGGDGESLLGYLLGFTVIQSIVAISVTALSYRLWSGDRLYSSARLLGGIVLGIGLGTLAEQSALLFA